MRKGIMERRKAEWTRKYGNVRPTGKKRQLKG
jgi:hypothetical protein